MSPATRAARSQGPRWLEAGVLSGVRFYQAALRPLNPWGCKFYPSCSHYALEAVERHGLWRGGGLALRRLLRCRPGVFGGYDPVPCLSLSAPQGSGRQADGAPGPDQSRETVPTRGLTR